MSRNLLQGRRGFVRAAVPVIAALLLGGCAGLGAKLQAPKLSLVGIQMQDATFFEQRMLVRLRVQNPNDLVLPVKGLTVAFELAGVHFAEGVSARAFDVPALGEAEFDMMVTANAATALMEIFGKDGKRPSKELDYRISGKLSTSIGLLRSVPFDETGRISVDSLMRGRSGKAGKA
ncbi:MAG: hypothetical protein H6R27_459 [Proteobacteria bacterium]|nr:hypothetical protein [Pseudomonadota bacterium]